MIKEIKQRWKAESPDFWKKVKHFSVTLGLAAQITKKDPNDTN